MSLSRVECVLSYGGISECVGIVILAESIGRTSPLVWSQAARRGSQGMQGVARAEPSCALGSL